MTDLIPLISLIGYFFFLKNNHLNHFLVSLIFLSFLMFATNYTHYGLEIDIFRYLHRSIGVLIAISLIFFVVKHRVNFLKEPAILILVFFFLTLFFSFFGNDLYMPYYYHYVRNFIFIALIVSFLYFKIDSNDKLDELFKLILYLTLLLAFVAIYELFKNDPLASYEETLNQKWGRRIKLFYSNPNYFAYALIPGFVISLFSKSKYKLLASSIILLAIFSTGSRSVQLASVLVVILFIFYNYRSKTFKFLSLASLMALVYLAIFSSFSFFERIITNQNVDKSRIAFTFVAFNAFNARPINGIGYGQFRIKFYDYIDQNVIDMEVSEIKQALASVDLTLTNNDLESMGIKERNLEIMTHNDLLVIVSELGVFGIAFLFYLFYRLYFEYRSLWLQDRRYFYIVQSMQVSSLVFSLFHNNLTSFVFWFILLLPFIINRNYYKIGKSSCHAS